MKQNTEAIILQTARSQFMHKGFAATRMQEIADEAGINKALLHYYFRSKDKLYQEIIKEMIGNIIPKFSGIMAGPGSFIERTEKLVDSYLSTFKENPHIPIFIMSEISQKRESFINEIKKHEGHFQGIQSFLFQMQKEMDEGKLKRIPPFHLLMNIMGMTIFPFMTKPIISTVLKVSEKQFADLMSERKEVIMNFIKSSTKISEDES